MDFQKTPPKMFQVSKLIRWTYPFIETFSHLEGFFLILAIFSNRFWNSAEVASRNPEK